MITTVELLAATKRAQGITSSAALARSLNVPEKSVYRWVGGKHTPDDETAARLAELAGLDVGMVVASINAERAAAPAMRTLWEGIATRLERAGVAAVAVFLTALLGGTPPPAQASHPKATFHDAGQSVYYVNLY